MNKKQLIVIWMAAISVIVALGLKTTAVYKLSEIMKDGGPERGNTALMLYGSQLFNSSNAGPLCWMLQLGEYKYQLIVGILIIGCLLIYTLRDKNK